MSTFDPASPAAFSPWQLGEMNDPGLQSSEVNTK